MNEIKQRLKSSSNWLDLIEDLEREADAISDKEERAHRLYVLGQACEELFLRKDKAMVSYQKAFKLHPQNVRPLVRARQIYNEMGNLKMVAKLIDFQLKVEREARPRAELLVELANVHIDLGSLDEARERLNEAHACDADAEGLDEAIATVSYDPNAWQQVVASLRQQAEASLAALRGEAPVGMLQRDTGAFAALSAPEKAARLLIRAARIYRLEAADDPAREELLRAAVEADSKNELAYYLLESLLHEQGRTDEIIELHNACADSAPEGERALLYRELATRWAIRFVDVTTTARFYEAALSAFYTDGADPFPGHLAAFNFLREVRAGAGQGGALLELADQALEAPLLEDDLLLLGQLAADIAWNDLGDVERASAYFGWVWRLDPENELLDRFLSTHPEARELVEAEAEPEAEAAADDEAGTDEPEHGVGATESSSFAASFAAPDRELPDAGLGVYALESSDVAGGQALEPAEPAVDDFAHQRSSDTQESVAVRAPETDEAMAAAQEYEPSALDYGDDQEMAAQAPDAVGSEAVADNQYGYESAAAYGDEEAEAEREEVAASEEPEELEDSGEMESGREPDQLDAPLSGDEDGARADDTVAAASSEFGSDAPDAEVLEAQAPIPSDHAASTRPALEVDEEVDPTTAAAFSEAAAAEAESTERGIDAWRRLALQHKELRTPRRALARLYTETERWNQLVDVLKEEVNLVADPLEQRAMLLEMAELYRDRLRLDVMVVNTLNQALKLDDGDVEILDALISQYEKMSRWTDLIANLKKKAVAVVDVTERVDLWTRIAALFVDRFSNQAEAIKAYEEILELDPGHRVAINQLKEMYERRRDWDKLINVYKSEIEMLGSDEERAVACLDVAKLASAKLKRPAVSMELWAKVVEYDPSNIEALEQLETLYERAKDWDNLADVCRRQTEIIDDPARKAQILQKLGILFSDKAEDDQRAIDVWNQLLEIEPDNRRAQDSLKKLYLAARAYDQLETFYAAQDKYDEFIRVLERQVDTEDPETRLSLSFKIAELWQTKLDKPDRAARAYEKVLGLDEENLRAAEALIPLYQGGRDVAKYAKVLEIQLAHTEDAQLQLERIRQLAELAEESARNKQEAFDWYLKAFAVDPRAEWTREQAERLAGEVGQWPQLVDAYEAAVNELVDPLDQLPVLLTVARVHEQELANTEEALGTNTRILEIEPQNGQAVEALERLYTSTQQWTELLDIYQRKIELVDGAHDRKEIYFRIAYLYEEELDDAERAIEAYRVILDVDVDDTRALKALDGIYQRLERWEDLAEAILRQLALASTDDLESQIALKFRLGQLREQELEDVPGAIDAYRDILTLQGEHEGARLALEGWLDSPTAQLEVAAILEPIYTELEAWQPLVRVHEIQLACEEDPLAKVELLLKIGGLWVQRMADGDKAFDAYSRCFRLEPTNELARVELERLAAIGERWDELAALYEGATTEALDAPLQHELLLKLAQLMDEQLEAPERAIEFFRRAQQLEPDHGPTLDALQRLYERAERWDEVLEIYRRKAELSLDAGEREGFFSKMAYIWEEMLGSPQEAIACYGEILALDDGNMGALRALDRLYTAQGSWSELAENLGRQLGLASADQERVDFLIRLANLRRSELGELAMAVETYRQALEIDPVNGEAVSALEGLIGNEEHQLAIAQILEPYYKNAADWERLIGVYEIMVTHAYDPVRKIELLHGIARLHEESGDDPVSAFDVYGRALREDAAHEQTQSDLERLARVLGHWEQLVALYDELVADVMDELLSVALHMKVAAIYELELSNPAAAAEAYKRILAIDPQSLAAVESLEQIYMRSEQYPELVGVLQKKAEIVLDAEQRKQLFFRAAQINEELLEDLEAAIRVYRQVLEIDDSDGEAIGALERLYVRLERWEDLRDIYGRKAELTDNTEEKKAIFYGLGRVYVEQLGDVDRAIETFQNILDLDPDDLNAIRALDELFQRSARWYDLLQVLERQVELAPETSTAVEVKFRIGKLWEGDLGDLNRAIETYRDILASDPTHEPTLAALEAIVHGEGEPVLAAGVLEPVYEECLEWAKLVELYEVMVRHVDDPIRKLELLHKIAELQELRMGEAQRAFEAYGRALSEDSADEIALAALERLAGQIDGWEALANLYETEFDKLLDPNRQVEMGLRVARVHEEELNQPLEAIRHYRRVLEAELENRDAMLALDRLYGQTNQWEELAEILRRQIRMAETDQDVLDLQFRLGQLQQLQLNDIANAIESYREILTNDPGHGPSSASLELLFADGQYQLEIAEILEPLYRMAEEWEKLVTIMEVRLGHLEHPLDKVQAVSRIAEICEQRLGDHTRAFRWWGFALQFDPSGEQIAEELERLARVVDGWEELTTFYSAVIDALGDDEKRRSYKVVARVFDEELGDLARAEEAYLSVLQLDAMDPEALEALDRIYTQASMPAELAEIIKRRIGITDGTEELIELHLRLGATYHMALSEPENAISAYNDALDLDSRQARALDALEVLYFQTHQWQALYDTYEKMIDIGPGDEWMADCYARMAKIASDALADPQRAGDLWNRVLDMRGEDPVALWALADLYEAAGEWRELVEVLQRQVNITHEPHAQVRLYKRLGRIWGEKLERERNALENWQRVLEIDASDLTALYAIAKIYRDTQAWEELVETLHRLIDIGITSAMEDEDLKALYIQLGELQGEILLRPNEAIDAWRKVVELQPDSFQALGALEQLLTQELRWTECVEVLERKLEVVESAVEQIDVLMQIANVWQEKALNPEGAAGAYERVLEREAGNRVAFTALNQIYREGWHWEKLVDLLLARVDLCEELAETVELLQEVAKVYEQHLNQPEAAFMVLQAAFKQDYSNDVTVKELERLAQITGRWNELLAECNTIVQTIPDPDIKSNLMVNMGIWYGSVGHVEYAVASVQQALQSNPENKRALETLATFHRQSGQWSELVQVMSRHQELEDNPERRVTLLCAMAEVYELQLADQVHAIGAYRKALQVDEANLEVLNALERLYRANAQWDGLIAALARKAELVEDVGEIIELRTRIGDLYEDQLEDPRRAIEAFKDILVTEPQHLPTLRALARLYENAGQTEDYLDILEQQLDVATTDDERIGLYTRIAATWEEQFNKLDRAADSLEKVLLLDERNVASYRTLERLYANDGRFEDLVETYRRHINAIQDSQERIGLYQAMGETYENSLQDPDRAIEAYTDMLSFDPDHTAALDALARLYEGIEAWDRAVDAMGRLVQLVDDAVYRVNLFYRLGRIHEEQLEDQTTAEERYAQALELDSCHAPSMVQLIEIYKARGDWAKAVGLMVRAEEFTANQLEKTRLLFEAGTAQLNELGDERAAVELFARTLAIDPDHDQAGEPLAALYFRDERYAEAEPVLDMLVRKADRRDNRRLQELYYRLAKSCDVLQKNDKAIKYYRSAYEIDSTHLPTLLGMADLLHRMEEWDRAFKIYQTILVHHRDSQDSDRIVDIFYRLGNIKLQLSERKKALNMFEKALEIDAYHRPTLEAVVDLQTKQSDWPAVVAAKQALLNVASEDEQFATFNELADIYRTKLDDLPAAIEALERATELRPDSNPVLHQLLELFSATAQWERAVEVVLRLADKETMTRIKARYCYTAAVVYRDKLQDIERSVEYFNISLDHQLEGVTTETEVNPADLKAFEALDRICTERKDWKTQERSYRKMIKRLSAEGQQALKVMLWHALGEIYRSRLRDFPSAIAAFEVAASLEPDTMPRHEILAELYLLSGPDYADKAIAEHQTLIQHSPYRIESYQALRKIYMDTKHYDKAWSLCATLSFLKKASAEEQQFYEQYRQRGFVRAKARMSEDMWRRDVFHPLEDPLVGYIFATVGTAIAPRQAKPHKKYGLKKKERRDLANDKLLFSQVFNYVTSVLNVRQADLFLQPNRPTGLQMAHTEEAPSFVVGADLLQGRPEKELGFAVAKELTNLRPEHFMRRVFTAASQLRVIFFSALRIFSPSFPVPPADEAEVNTIIKEVRTRMHAGTLEQLGAVVQRFLARGEQIDLNRWLLGVEQTSNRVGFIICNDLEVAAKMVSTEPVVVGGLQAKDKVKELVLYSVSEEYFRVRQELGLTIGQ